MNACLLAAYFGENETLKVCTCGILAAGFDIICVVATIVSESLVLFV